MLNIIEDALDHFGLGRVTPAKLNWVGLEVGGRVKLKTSYQSEWWLLLPN
jgi:hypothetical protein